MWPLPPDIHYFIKEMHVPVGAGGVHGTSRVPCKFSPRAWTPPKTSPHSSWLFDHGFRVPARPQRPPTFLSLPDIAHASIASFLPDGGTRGPNRLRVSEVSRTHFETYGGSLTRISILYVQGSSTARLAAPASKTEPSRQDKNQFDRQAGEHPSALLGHCPRLLPAR